MTFDMQQYRQLALRTESPVSEETKYRLVRCWNDFLGDTLEGIAEEGQMLDRLKRYIYYGKDDAELVEQMMPSYPVGEKRQRLEQCCRLIHFLIGLIGECGEVAEEVVAYIEENKPMNKTNMRAEGGDLLWYLNGYGDELGISILEMAIQNLAKLQTRYKDKFTLKEAIERDSQKELAAVDYMADGLHKSHLTMDE